MNTIAVRLITIWVVVLLTASAICCADVETRSDLEGELAKLKAAYKNSLIPEDIYREKVRDLLGMPTAPQPPSSQAPSGNHSASTAERKRPTQHLLNGIWHVRVSHMGPLVPPYILEKYLGVTWKVILYENRLTVLEHSLGSDSWVTSSDPERLPYRTMKVQAAQIDPKGERVKFRIDRGFGTFEAWEAFDLERISVDEFSGYYKVHDRYGAPGAGPDYSGTIRLERYD